MYGLTAWRRRADPASSRLRIGHNKTMPTVSVQSNDEAAGHEPSSQAVDNFDSAVALICASTLFILGTLSTLITPSLLQGWASQFGWGESWLGYIAMVELAGLALGSISAFYWQRRYDWRVISRWAIVTIVAANAFSAVTTSFALLCFHRILSGIAGGVLVGVYTAYLSNTRAPEKFLAVTTFLQLATQAALMALSATLIDRWAMNGMYALLAFSVVVLLPTLRFLPKGWPSDVSTDDASVEAEPRARRSWIPGLLMLAAFIPFQIFQGGIFSFLQEFGPRGAGMDSTRTMHLIGISAMFSAVGPAAAYILADRAGVLIPLVVSILLMLVVMTGMTSAPYSPAALLLFLSLIQASWYFTMCYLYAGLIKIDNVLTQAASPLSALCLAAGASVMGVTVETRGLAGMFWISLTCLILLAATALPALYLAHTVRASRDRPSR